MTPKDVHRYYIEVVKQSPPRLLFPEGSPQSAIHVSSHAAEDLGVDSLSELLQTEGLRPRDAYEILAAPVSDPEVIRYRQEVFKDFRTYSDLRETFRALLPRFDELSSFTRARREATSPLQQTIWRLGELELLVECVERLAEALESSEGPDSRALRDLDQYLAHMRARKDYQTMRDRLPELRGGLQYRKSVTIGVNLDDKLRPVEVAVLDIHDKPFVERSLVGRLFGSQREFSVSSAVLSSPIPSELSAQDRSRIPLAPLFQEIEQMLSSALRPIQRALRAYVHENTELFRGLRREAAFFLGAVALAERFEKKQLPTCIPEITDVHADESIEDLYNPHLPLRSERGAQEPETIVLNDLRFTADQRFFVLTGPNQGGKTTFTQAVGLVHLFAQTGIFVPAGNATIAPADVLDTHFPTAEHGSLETGRLSDEASRLSEIVDNITHDSLILLNESFASTSPHEAVSLAGELLKVLAEVGVRGIFATHLHELALNTEDFGRCIAPLTAEAVITDDSAKRTYRVREGTPSGSSFARDIAVKHGLSYEQMKSRLRSRGLRI